MAAPKKQATALKGATKKMGRSSFKPADRFQIKNKDPRFAYRFISRKKFLDGGNYDHRGWTPVGGFNRSGELVDQSGDIKDDTTCVTSSKIVGDLILARMPKADAEERNKYYASKDADRLKSLRDEAQADRMRDGIARVSEYSDTDNPHQTDGQSVDEDINVYE
jgi:hypothetical protein